MAKFKKILVGLDFSKTSDEALELASQLAENNGASMHLFYVLPKPNFYDLSPAGMPAVVLDTKYFEKTQKEATEMMKTAVFDLSKKRPYLIINTEISGDMDTAQAIIDAAKSKKADLIVLGSHGRRGLERVLLGSVAESVLRHAPCAVMIFKSKGVSKKPAI